MPADSGLTFVVVVHLASDFESTLPEMLARCTTMPVTRGRGRREGRSKSRLRDWPTVLLAAKAYGSVFYDKLTPSIVRTKW
jgi:hypothetical protein